MRDAVVALERLRPKDPVQVQAILWFMRSREPASPAADARAA